MINTPQAPLAMPKVHHPSLVRSAIWLQSLTVCWMLIECSAALTAAYHARSAALLAFGSDSFVELISALVVLLQFSPATRLRPERAAYISGMLLFVLSGVVAFTSLLALMRGKSADTSRLGIAITAAALVLMPVMAWLKRRKARELKNRAMAADAVQSATCAYLAAVTLLSLLINAFFHIGWVDSVAALLAIPLLVSEGRRATRGESCSCC